MLKHLCETHGVESVIAVPHNIVGPRQKYDDPFRNVMSIMLNRMLQGKQPIIYGDGEQKSEYIYVEDVVNAFDLAIKTDKNFGKEEIHVGSGKNFSVLEFFPVFLSYNFLIKRDLLIFDFVKIKLKSFFTLA